MDRAGDFVDGEPAPGKEPFEIPGADAGEDVPQLRPLASLQLGCAKGARERRAAWSLRHARQVIGGERGKEIVRLVGAAGWRRGGPRQRIVEPGEREGSKPSGAFGPDAERRERFAGTAYQGAVFAQAFPARVPAVTEATLDPPALVAREQLLAGENAALRVVRRGVEVGVSDFGEIDVIGAASPRPR